MMNAQEKLAEVKAENELLTLGWGKGKCPICEQGFLPAPEGLRGYISGVQCSACGGSGISWVKVEAPIAKLREKEKE